jgi:hypothetical protein
MTRITARRKAFSGMYREVGFSSLNFRIARHPSATRKFGALTRLKECIGDLH